MFSHLHNLSDLIPERKSEVKLRTSLPSFVEFSPGFYLYCVHHWRYPCLSCLAKLSARANHNLHNAQILHDASQVTTASFKNKQKSLHSIKRRHVFRQPRTDRDRGGGWKSELIICTISGTFLGKSFKLPFRHSIPIHFPKSNPTIVRVPE